MTAIAVARRIESTSTYISAIASGTLAGESITARAEWPAGIWKARPNRTLHETRKHIAAIGKLRPTARSPSGSFIAAGRISAASL